MNISNPGGSHRDVHQPDRPRSRDAFPSTIWMRIEQAQDSNVDESRDALAALCEAYWQPVYAFIRYKGHDPDRAADLTQDFFALLIEPGALAAVSQGKGKFRSYLMAACTHFLSNQRVYERALKRGGGRSPVSIDQRVAENLLEYEPFHELTPERIFMRQWATTVLDRVMCKLLLEAELKGKARLFDLIKTALLGREPSASYAEIASTLGVTETSIKTAVHRYRNRFRVLVRDEIARTVDDPEEVEHEITTLIEALTN